MATLCAALVLGAAAPAREAVSVATPFEVGDSPSGNYLAALVAGAERDTFAAATFFREALRAAPNNRELMERAFVASLANGNMPESFALADRLVKVDPGNGLANLALGVRAIKQKRWKEARARIAKGGGPGRQRDLTSTLLTAWTYSGAGAPAQAEQHLDRMRDEALAVVRDYNAALMADLAGRPDEARKKFEAVYRTDKSTLRVLDSYARFLSRNNAAEEARKVYQTFDQVLSRHPVVVAGLTALGENKPLPRTVRDAVEGAGEALYGLGAIGGRQGDELAAMIYLRLALYLLPDNAFAQLTLADVYERLKQYDQAIDVYGAIAETSPLRANADIQIGLLLEQMDRKDQALAHLDKVAADNPKDSEAYVALGNLQRARKDYDAAIASYTRALELSGRPEKSLWSLYYFRGTAYERAKNWPAAEADFKKALELYPDQPLVLNYLGYSWVDKNINLDEAFRMLRRAVELRPQDGYIADSLAWAHYKLGRYDEAVKELERAVELKPADPVINDHLGDAYWRVGRKLEAVFQWNHARDLKPEPDELPNILRKIEHGLDDPKPASAEAATPKSGG